MSDYWNAIYSTQGLQGGFIWDWMEQGIARSVAKRGDWRPEPEWACTLDELKRDVLAGKPRWYWGYGGDFGDVPNDVDFCCNGMVWPDWSPKPAMHEFKRLVQPLAAEWHEGRKADASVVIHNRAFFRRADWLWAEWVLECNGEVKGFGKLPALSIDPGGAKSFPVRLPKFTAGAGEEWHLTLRYFQKEATLWAPAGHEVGWDQWLIARGSVPSREKPASPDVPVSVRQGKTVATVEVGPIKAKLDARKGLLRALELGGRPVLLAGPRLNILRGWTDNDGVKGKPEQWKSPRKPLGRWMTAGLDKLKPYLESFALAQTDGGVEWRSLHRYATPALADAIIHEQTARLLTDGCLEIDQRFTIHKDLRDLPRIGIRCTVDGAFYRLAWFGRGPHESYIDRRYGARVGRFESTVDDDYVPYILPQENGTKVDLRWLALADAEGGGLRITADQHFSASASRFRIEDYIAAYHTHELTPRPDIELCVDIRQRGLGTASCGPDTLPQYRVEPGVWEQKLRFELGVGG